MSAPSPPSPRGVVEGSLGRSGTGREPQGGHGRRRDQSCRPASHVVPPRSVDVLSGTVGHGPNGA